MFDYKIIALEKFHRTTLQTYFRWYCQT